MNILVNMHSLSEAVCQFVVDSYADRDQYKDNATVQMWVEQSKARLKELHELRS